MENASYVKFFSYEIITKAVYTKDKQFKYGRVVSPNCVLCNKAPETLRHLFCDCEVSSAFWEQNIRPIVSDIVGENLVHLSLVLVLFSRYKSIM